MTRNEFLDDVLEWDELFNVANEHGCESLCDVFTYDAMHDYIMSEIPSFVESNSWQTLRDRLDDIDTDCNYFEYYGMLEFRGIDEDFESYKDMILREIDNDNGWDEEEEDEEEDDYYIDSERPNEEDSEEVVEETISIEELISSTYMVMSS